MSAENWELVSSSGVIIRDLAWSEDGRYLAFASNPTGQYDLFALDMAAAAVVQLTDTADLDEIAPRWRPPLE